VRIRAAGLPLPKHFITASDITHSKPHPEPYMLGAKSVGFPPRDCVVIEDAPSGIRSGKSAGTRVIAVRTTSTQAELIQAGADWIVENCAALSVRRNSSNNELLLQLEIP
jgi:beta-phosphoglucomutase-like phosphatase (HAD superfamily)